MDAWETKQIRETRDRAQTELTIALAGGMKKKGGGKLALTDFLPDFAKPKRKKRTPKEAENELKAALMGMTKKK